VLVRCVFDLVFVISMDDSFTIGNISGTRLECVCVYICIYVVRVGSVSLSYVMKSLFNMAAIHVMYIYMCVCVCVYIYPYANIDNGGTAPQQSSVVCVCVCVCLCTTSITWGTFVQHTWAPCVCVSVCVYVSCIYSYIHTMTSVLNMVQYGDEKCLQYGRHTYHV